VHQVVKRRLLSVASVHRIVIEVLRRALIDDDRQKNA
jgi:hypothetical protein